MSAGGTDSKRLQSSSSATGSSYVDHFMAEARAKYTTHPELLPQLTIPLTVPTPEELDFDERLDAAVAKSFALVAEAEAQLAAPCTAPDELTPAEEAEQARNEAWDREYLDANRYIDEWGQRNQELFDEVMGIIDDFEEADVPLQDDVTVPAPPAETRIQELSQVPPKMRQQLSRRILDSMKPYVDSEGWQIDSTSTPDSEVAKSEDGSAIKAADADHGADDSDQRTDEAPSPVEEQGTLPKVREHEWSEVVSWDVTFRW